MTAQLVNSPSSPNVGLKLTGWFIMLPNVASSPWLLLHRTYNCNVILFLRFLLTNTSAFPSPPAESTFANTFRPRPKPPRISYDSSDMTPENGLHLHVGLFIEHSSAP